VPLGFIFAYLDKGSLDSSGLEEVVPLAVGVIFALATALLALLALDARNNAWSQHLLARYSGKSYDDLTPKEQADLNSYTSESNLFRKLCFGALVIELAGLSLFFTIFLGVG
jgi:hypothetical protein